MLVPKFIIKYLRSSVVLLILTNLGISTHAMGLRHRMGISVVDLNPNYYYGVSDIQIYFPSQGPLSHEEMLMKRIIDPTNGYLIELACLRPTGKTAYASPFYLKVTGNQIQVADTKDVNHPIKFSGTAELSGPNWNWNWNFLRFSMDYIPFHYHIADTNTVTEKQIIARKKIFMPDGSLFETYNVDGDKITLDEFNTHFSEMGCPELDVYP